MPQIESIIDKVRDHAQQERDIDQIRGIMVHRCGIDDQTGVVLGHTGEEIANAFIGRDPRWASVAKVTGSQNPYTFYIGGPYGNAAYDGMVWQALPLDEIGHHGRRFSRGHIGVALIGDFRAKSPSKPQAMSLISLCADLCLFLGMPARMVVGHGEIKGAHGGNKGPGQPGACPGDLCSMPAVRSAVRDQMAIEMHRDAAARLALSGAILPST